MMPVIPPPLSPPSSRAPLQGEEPGRPSRDARFQGLVHRYRPLVRKTLRRLGVASADVEDGAQHVFLVALCHLDRIRPESERRFLLATSVRVSSERRRCCARLERLKDMAPGWSDLCAAACPSLEELVDLERARKALEQILRRMPSAQRAVFVRRELDEQTTGAIAMELRVPRGTVASRLRLAKKAFRVGVARARLASRGLAVRCCS